MHPSRSRPLPRRRSVASYVTLGALALLGGCDDTALPQHDARVPWPVTPFPATDLDLSDAATRARVELGEILFQDPILSSDRTVACLTCHSPIWGLSDGLAVSVGIGGHGPIGPGRSGPNLTPRNSQTVWNAAFRENLLWDGRADSLAEQIRLALENEAELGRDLEDIAADLAGIDEYVQRFAAAFPGAADPLAPDHILVAIADFERTLISDDAPYDRYVRGDDGALAADEIEGMHLFSELGCATCHVPPLFESERFELAPVGDFDHDGGRADVTDDAADRGRFRVPTLRNARETGPWFHDGSVRSLLEAVSVEVAFRTGREPTEAEVSRIEAFIRNGLMDKSRFPRMLPSVPSGLPVPRDGYRVQR